MEDFSETPRYDVFMLSFAMLLSRLFKLVLEHGVLIFTGLFS